VSAEPDWRRAELLARFARRMFPALSGDAGAEAGTEAGTDAGGVAGVDAASPTSRWLGHRPSTPDGLPVIGPSPAHPDVLHAFGHGHVGLAAAPATAELVADLLAGRSPAIDPQPYRPGRF
jgi:D-amino-acid dehydrogenase